MLVMGKTTTTMMRKKRRREIVHLSFQQTKPRSGFGGRKRVRPPIRPHRLLHHRVFHLGHRSQ
jgi:hypothetical protein